MGKMLIIAEKPSVAREIAGAIKGFSKVDGWLESKDTIISSGVGHLVEIFVPEAATTGRDLGSLPVLPKKFELQAIEKTKPQFIMLKKLMGRSDVDMIVNACDAGREGELIFRLIYELANCKKPMKRMWLQSMTQQSILEAFKNMRPGADYDDLCDAAKCRSEADWMIGINGSRGITRLRERQTRNYQMLTAGRVQTPTLAIITHRDLEINNFVPKDYWEINANFIAKAGSYVGKWFNSQTVKLNDESAEESDDDQNIGSRFFDKNQAQIIIDKCRGQNPSSVKDQNKLSSSLAPRLFDLTTLQREANKKFKLSAKQTLDIAQALYEKHKATSYPRTDATALPEDYVPKAREVMGQLKNISSISNFANSVLANNWIQQDKRIFDDKKITDHFAIIPTGAQPNNMDANETKIYDMIVKRFIAVFYPAAQYSNTTRISIIANESFKTSGRVLLKQGWLEVYGAQTDDKTPSLCALENNEKVTTKSIELKSLSTKPPSRFTEATLLAAMEGAGKLVDDDELRQAMKERGLGTPATRAAIIEGLLNNKDGKGQPKESYIVREGKEQYLVPTNKGNSLIEFLDTNNITSLTSPKMTGEWEQKLLEMEKGNYSRDKFMNEIFTMTKNIIEILKKRANEVIDSPDSLLKNPCPKCGSKVICNGRTYDCQSSCGFKIWSTVAGRQLTNKEIDQLIKNGKTDVLENFISKAKKKFSAALKLNKDFTIAFDFESNNQDNENSSNTPTISLNTPCPICKGKISLKSGMYPQYVCSSGDFKIWQKIAGRLLTADEANTLFKDGELEKKDGFISKANKEFSAALKLSKDKTKIEFVFS